MSCHPTGVGPWQSPLLCATRAAKGPTVAGVALLGVDWSPFPQRKPDRPTRTNGHQNRCLINMQVRVAPGWQASPDEWPHCRTLVRTDSGTNNRPSGHPAGIVVPRSAVRTLDSTPQVTATATRSWGRMGTGRVGLASASKICDNASGLPFLEPGR